MSRGFITDDEDDNNPLNHTSTRSRRHESRSHSTPEPPHTPSPVPFQDNPDLDIFDEYSEVERETDFYSLYSDRLERYRSQRRPWVHSCMLHCPVILLALCFFFILHISFQASQFNYSLHHSQIIKALEFDNQVLSNHIQHFSSFPTNLLRLLRNSTSHHHTTNDDGDTSELDDVIAKRDVELMIKSLLVGPVPFPTLTTTTHPSINSNSNSTLSTNSTDTVVFANEFKQDQLVNQLLHSYHDHPIGILNAQERHTVFTMIENHLEGYQLQRDELIDAIHDQYERHQQQQQPPARLFRSICDTTHQHIHNLLTQFQSNILHTSRCLRHSDCIRFISPLRSHAPPTIGKFNCPFALHHADEQLTFDIFNSINNSLCDQWYHTTCSSIQPEINHVCPALHPVKCINHVCSVVNTGEPTTIPPSPPPPPAAATHKP